ncbi:hypothetical protein [Actinokineospora sp. NPDC004072]
MTSWRGDDEMRDIAVRLAEKIFEMYTAAGEWIPSWGGPSGNPRQTYTDSLILDAEDFMALDPQRITDEYLRIQRAARDTGEHGEAKAELEVAGARLSANWRGEAATAFAKQMSFIDTFMTQQQDRLLLAVQAMGAVYKLAVEIRRSYYELADATIAACDIEMGKQASREAKANIGMGSEIAKAVIGAFTGDSLRGLLTSSLDSIISISTKGAEIALEGSEAGAVVDSYIRHRDELRRSWESGLLDIRDWLNQQDAELGRDEVDLLEPLPATADVDSPDFRYEHFANANHSVESYSPRVDHERRRMAEEEAPSGVIAERLGTS